MGATNPGPKPPSITQRETPGSEPAVYEGPTVKVTRKQVEVEHQEVEYELPAPLIKQVNSRAEQLGIEPSTLVELVLIEKLSEPIYVPRVTGRTSL